MQRLKQMSRRLSVRVIAVSTLLAALALILVGTIIGDLYRNAIERRFDALLSAHLFALVTATDVTAQKRLVGAPQLGDPRYGQPDSGWYWEVTPVSDGVTGRLASPFLTSTLPAPTTAEAPFDAGFERRYTVAGPQGEELRTVETEVELGTEAAIARLRVMGDLDEVHSEAAEFRRQIGLYLSATGLLMIAVNALAMMVALRPLDRARMALGAVRKGEAQRLDGSFPPEIEPLAEEINALIDSNRRIVDRARVQVGDLAHALKTPLAVITNEAGSSAKGALPGVIAEQAAVMRRQIDHYLQRARFAAQKGTVAYRTDIGPVLDKLVRVFAKLNPDKTINHELDRGKIVFAGEAQDLEEILGNLLENSSKWAVSRISVSGVVQQAERFTLIIDDDGPGIAPERRDEALKRGRRLDETKPGTGLGLSIVSELAREYGGTVDLSVSPMGGLRVTVALPMASA
jgi:signal transduction histidine kinase